MAQLINLLPEAIRDALPSWAWYLIFGLTALIVLLVLFSIVARLLRRSPQPRAQNLEERLGDYPPLKPSSGDRRLLIEGVPVRLRLLVVAPAGKESDVDVDKVDQLLDRVLPGLGDICRADKPRVRVWPLQLSYEGFAKHLHRNTIIPEGENQLSKWAVVAGRAKLPEGQVMLGLALEAIKPNTVGRRSIQAHEWASLLRVRVRE